MVLGIWTFIIKHPNDRNKKLLTKIRAFSYTLNSKLPKYSKQRTIKYDWTGGKLQQYSKQRTIKYDWCWGKLQQHIQSKEKLDLLEMEIKYYA